MELAGESGLATTLNAADADKEGRRLDGGGVTVNGVLAPVKVNEW